MLTEHQHLEDFQCVLKWSKDKTGIQHSSNLQASKVSLGPVLFWVTSGMKPLVPRTLL